VHGANRASFFAQVVIAPRGCACAFVSSCACVRVCVSMCAPIPLAKVKVKVYTGGHQRAFKKGSQLVLTLAPVSLKNEKEKQHRLMRNRRVVSHAIRPAPSPPEASRSTSNPPSRSPPITVAVVKVYSVSCFCDLV